MTLFALMKMIVGGTRAQSGLRGVENRVDKSDVSRDGDGWGDGARCGDGDGDGWSFSGYGDGGADWGKQYDRLGEWTDPGFNEYRRGLQ